jgi:hypothetical protein
MKVPMNLSMPSIKKEPNAELEPTKNKMRRETFVGAPLVGALVELQ